MKLTIIYDNDDKAVQMSELICLREQFALLLLYSDATLVLWVKLIQSIGFVRLQWTTPRWLDNILITQQNFVLKLLSFMREQYNDTMI